VTRNAAKQFNNFLKNNLWEITQSL